MTEQAPPFEGFPFIVGWELTLACNLRCRHCGSSAGLPRRNELTTAEALEICDQLPALLVQEVDFTGGEPLMRPDWPVIAGRLIELEIPTNVLTNGRDVDAASVSRMKQVGISGVGISLDGLAATHDLIRGRGSYAAVLRAMELLREARIPFNVITTVNALNLAELPQLQDVLESTGADAWRLQPLIPMGRVATNQALCLGEDAILRIGQFVREQSRAVPGPRVRIICSDGLEYVEPCAPGERPWRGCSAGIVSCGITSDGRVKGCLSMPDELCEGDLRQRSLWDIWFDPGAFPYTRRFTQAQLGPGCRDCPKGLECLGGCSASSYAATGVFHNDPACFYAAERRRALASAVLSDVEALRECARIAS